MNKRRILSSALALCLTTSLLPTAAFAARASDYTDVGSGSWYYKYVDYVTDKGYFAGTSADEFSPDATMTRAMFVTVLAKLDGQKVDNRYTAYADVPAGSWYAGSVKWAADNNIVSGVGDGRFNPDGEITREQMCAIMNRFIEYYSDKTGKTHQKNGTTTAFPDEDQVSAYAKEAVKNCRIYGLIDGFEDGYFHPQANSTRAQVATVIYNLAWLISGGGSSSGGGGGGGGSTSSQYTITYYDGDTLVATEYTANVTSSSKSFTTHAALTKDNYTFVEWNTAKDGSGTAYTASTAYTATGSLTLYAVWKTAIAEDDLISKAMQKTIDDGLQQYITLINGVGSDNATMTVDFTYDPGDVDADSNAEREQNINVSAKLNEEFITKLIATATTIGVQVADGTATQSSVKEELTKTEVYEIANEVKTALAEYGIVVEDATMQSVKEAVYAAYQAAYKEGSKLWLANFVEDGRYITGNVTVTLGKASCTVTVDEGNTQNVTNLDYTKEQKIALAKAFAVEAAKELTTSLQKNNTGEYVSVAEATTTLTFKFSKPSYDAHAAKTEEHPYTYPININLTLDADGMVQYKYDTADSEHPNYVKLVVSDAMKTAYNNGLKEIANAGTADPQLDEKIVKAVQEAMDTAIGGTALDSLIQQVKETYGVTLTVDKDAVVSALKADVETWLNANNKANRGILLTYASNQDATVLADLDNTVFADTIWEQIESQLTPENISAAVEALIKDKLDENGVNDEYMVTTVNNRIVAYLNSYISGLGDKIGDYNVTPTVPVKTIDDINALLTTDLLVVDVGLPVSVSGPKDADGNATSFGDYVKDMVDAEVVEKLNEMVNSSSGTVKDVFEKISDNTKDYLIYNTLVNELGLDAFQTELDATDEDSAIAELKSIVTTMAQEKVASAIDEKLVSGIVSKKDEIAQMAGDQEKYQQVMDLYAKLYLGTEGGLQDQTLGDLASILGNKDLQAKIGDKGSSYVKQYLSGVVGLLDQYDVEVTIGDAGSIDTSSLAAALEDADTTAEVMDALAKVINEQSETFKALKLTDFKEEAGQLVTVKYNTYSGTFHLVVDIPD